MGSFWLGDAHNVARPPRSLPAVGGCSSLQRHFLFSQLLKFQIFVATSSTVAPIKAS